MICESRSNFMPQYTKCACQAISSPDTSLKFDVPPPFFFFFLFFIILPLIQCTDSCQTCIHRQYVFGLFLPFLFLFFFVCQTRRIASLPFDATSSHAFACYCVEQQKTMFITNYSLFLKRCVIELPCMLDMYGFFVLFFFMCLKMSFLSDDSSMAFILHL